MSDERNADSVLFKLDTLKNTEADRAAAQGASRQMARLAAAAPASGGSGLIDIKELAGLSAERNAPAHSDAASVSASASANASASASSSAVLPDLLSSSSMLGIVTPSNASPAVTPAKAPSRVPLVVLSVLAVIALAAAVTAIVLRG